MGCWNETCGLTQMPICAGDPVRMFLIVENRLLHRGSKDVCISYGSESWRPFGLPLKGTYDEYGRIENIEEDCMSDFLLESIRERIVEVPNRMGEKFKREKLDWATVIDFLTDEGLKITDPFDVANITKKMNQVVAEAKALLASSGKKTDKYELADKQKEILDEDLRIVTMYHMMVHEDVYQAILKYNVPAERFSSMTSGDIKEVMRAGAKEYIAEVREHQNELSKMTEEEKSYSNLHRSLSRSDINFENRFVSITNHLDGSYGSGSYLRRYLDFVDKRIADGASDDDPQIQMLTEQFVGFASFGQTMTLMRKMWQPQSGKGGQDQEFVLHKYIGQVVSDFSDKKIKEWDEMMKDYGEEEDAEESQQVPTEEG
jgi:hypothetical protein